MYVLRIGGQAIEVSDWSQGIKRARDFHTDAEYAKSMLGDYQFSELGQGAIGLPIWRAAGRAAKVVGMVVRY